MIERILRAKHWQLFFLVVGISFIAQLGMMSSIIFNIHDDNSVPIASNGKMLLLNLIMGIPMGILFLWFWSIAIRLQNSISENIKMKVDKFKIFFFIPLIYILVFLFIVGTARIISSLLIIIVPLHLFSMFCIFYTVYFTAKTIKTAEQQREVSFGDFAGEFLLLWFFPIGIWIIQPKINKIIKDQSLDY